MSDPYKSGVYRRNRRIVIEAAGGRCYWPGCERIALTADHVIPLRHGGSHDLANLRACCRHHNSAGGARIANDIKHDRHLGRTSRQW